MPRTPEEQVSPELQSPRKEADLDQMTIAEFVKTKFLPEHIATKRTSGRRHYQAILKHVLTPEEVDRIFGIETSESKAKLKAIANWPYMNNVRLRNAHPDHVQSLVSAALEGGYSTQTAKHIRNVVSAVFTHAIKVHYFAGENPAISVASPGMTRRVAHTLTFEQTIKVLQVMNYPEMEIALLALLTEMNVAEICGLQWKQVNLARHSVNRGGELIPPMTIAVRSQLYRGELSNVPAARRKSIAIPHLLHAMFLRLSHLTITGWNDFVLISKGGRPINQINVAARRLKSNRRGPRNAMAILAGISTYTACTDLGIRRPVSGSTGVGNDSEGRPSAHFRDYSKPGPGDRIGISAYKFRSLDSELPSAANRGLSGT